MKAHEASTFGRRMPLAAFGFFVVCFALHPQSPLRTFHLSDHDDYMRLHRIVAWLEGQSWYDLSVPRLSPHNPAIVPWARLVDLPIAALAWPLRFFMDTAKAVMIAAMIVPLIGLALALALVTRLARLFVGEGRAGWAAVLFLFMPLLTFNFAPGRVDHHAWQALIAGFALERLLRILGAGDKAPQTAGGFLKTQAASCPISPLPTPPREGEGIRAVLGSPGVQAAWALGCGLWIGAETLLWAGAFMVVLGIGAAWGGAAVARQARWFGLTFPVVTAALVPVALPPEAFSSLALSWFSPAYALFAALGGGAVALTAQVALTGARKPLRFAAGLGLAVLAGGVFLALVPLNAQGVFADYNAFDATTALDYIREARPGMEALAFNRFNPAAVLGAVKTFALLFGLPLLGVGVCFVKLRTDAARRALWAAQSLFLGVATGLALFWQVRVGIFMQLFALTPVTVALCEAWKALARRLEGRALFAAEMAAFVLLAPLPVVFVPAVVQRAVFYPDVVLFPAARPRPSCLLDPVLPFLNDRDGLGSRAHTIMNTSNEGPQILFSTRHRVVAGNFNVAGNADAFAFFNATDDGAAQAALRQTGADWVLVCRAAQRLYLGKTYDAPGHRRIGLNENGKLHWVNTDPVQPLLQKLTRKNPPAWLKPIEIPVPSDYVLYEFQPTTD